MRDRVKPILAALAAGSIVMILGVVFLYGPIEAADTPTGPLMHPGLGFLIYMALVIPFFDWVSQQMQAPMKAAMTIAISLILLVDVEHVLHGERGVWQGAASVVLLLTGWATIGWVYGALLKRQGDSACGSSAQPTT